ncbi:hypothetical protein ACROYT_G029265 [Oculina patagonica]
MNLTQASQLNATEPTPQTTPLRSDAEVYIQVVVLVFISIGSVFGNAFVVAIIVFNHKLHKPTYYFIGSLASADFLVGAIYIPFYIVSSLAQEWYLSMAWCKWHAAFISLSLNASLMTLCLVSVDRFLAITDPLRYQTTLTSFRSAMLLLVGWVHSIFWAFAPQVGWGEVVYDAKTSTCRPNWGAKGLVKRVAMETKAMKTLLIVLGAFVVSWLPYTVCSVATMATKGSWELSSSTLNAVLTITMLNGCVNPVIYAIRDHRFRNGMKRMLCPLRSRESREFNSYLSTKGETTIVSTQENVELGNVNLSQETSGDERLGNAQTQT